MATSYSTLASERQTRSVGDWDAVLVLVIFILSNVAVIFPARLPVPLFATQAMYDISAKAKLIPRKPGPARRRHIHLDYITVPLIGVLVLLSTRAIDGVVLRKGILGADGVEPINIMALFISLAYLAISLDSTGLLQYAAFWVARKGGSSGQRLYLYLYIFFLVCGVVVGNDPVILSGTAFLAYFTKVTGIVPPTAWIFAQFASANMASVVLVSSNPTNLVLSGAFSLSFVAYTAHVILPFFAAALVVYPVLTFVLFRKPGLIPKTLDVEVNEDNGGAASQAALLDKHGAIFGSVLLLITLGVLVGTSTIGVPVWEVTAPPALIMLVRDVLHDWKHHRKSNSRGDTSPASQYPLTEVHSVPEGSSGKGAAKGLEETTHGGGESAAPISSPPESPPPGTPSHDLRTFMATKLGRVRKTFPTASTILSRLPTSLLPFAFLMFILVQALSSKGWVEVLAGWWSAWVERTGTLGAIGGMGFIACIFCNICGTNIGATILLARVLQVWIASGAFGSTNPRTREGAIFALAIGSNYGAFTLTFSASLAGLLWRSILRSKGIHVRQMQFLLLNAPIVLAAMLASCAVLVGQVYVIHRTVSNVQNHIIKGD